MTPTEMDCMDCKMRMAMMQPLGYSGTEIIVSVIISAICGIVLGALLCAFVFDRTTCPYCHNGFRSAGSHESYESSVSVFTDDGRKFHYDCYQQYLKEVNHD